MPAQSSITRITKRLLRSVGIDVSRYQPTSHTLAKKQQQLHDQKIDLLLDVGANAGQYAQNMREIGYRGRIVSFEPLSSAFEQIQQAAGRDSHWEVQNFALGDAEEQLEIHVAENSWSSSLLGVNDKHVSAIPSARCIGTEVIQVRTLDTVFKEVERGECNILLKIDTQGYEKNVLDGGKATLERVKLLQLEMSFVSLYDGQPLFNELYEWVCQRGFTLATLEDSWWDRNTGTLMQIDGVFQRIG